MKQFIDWPGKKKKTGKKNYILKEKQLRKHWIKCEAISYQKEVINLAVQLSSHNYSASTTNWNFDNRIKATGAWPEGNKRVVEVVETTTDRKYNLMELPQSNHVQPSNQLQIRLINLVSNSRNQLDHRNKLILTMLDHSTIKCSLLPLIYSWYFHMLH